MKRLTILLLLFASARAAWAGANADQAMQWLSEGMKDRQTMLQILMALRSTEDPAILPLFAALGENKDQDLRRIAPTVIMDVGGPSRATTLLARMADDTQPEIRSEVLLYLDSLDAVSVEMLKDAIAVPDERLQCLAARSLVGMGQGSLALETLRDLTKSTDLATASMARMALLKMGASEHKAPLAKLVESPDTNPAVLMLLMEQAAELNVTSAVELVEAVAADPARPVRVRTHAYKALAKLAPDGQTRLTRAIVSADLPMSIYLLVILSQTDNAAANLKTLAGRSDMVGTLARFELSRQADAEQLQRLATAAMELEHPIVINYILERALKDVKENPKVAKGYQQPVIALLQRLQSERQLRRPHLELISSGGRVLGELGTQQSLAELKNLLTGRLTAFSRALAAGLILVENPNVADVAVDLLDSPYDELAVSGAFAMGKFGHRAAAGKLREMVQKDDRYRPSLVALASWYLLKIDQAEAASVQKLAQQLR
ncbi:MAG: hypothetical protein ACLFUJ_09800 [Phycisphaerae bacterium]